MKMDTLHNYECIEVNQNVLSKPQLLGVFLVCVLRVLRLLRANG